MFGQDTIKLLLIEDDDGDARLLEHSFSQVTSFNSTLDRATTISEGKKMLAINQYDIILLDLALPDGQGIDLITEVKEVCNTPVIVLTGLNDEILALEAVKRGAHEYLVKGEIRTSFLPKVVRYAIESSKARMKLEEEVEKRTEALNEAHLRALRSERLAAVGQMVTGIAHESRNALQRIQASVNKLMRRSKGSEEIAAIAEDIDLAIDDLRHVYDTVRDYAQPIQLARVEEDIIKIIDSAAERVRLVETGAQIDLLYENKCENAIVSVDERAMQQVFRNLIENAYQACEENSVVIRITTETISVPAGDFLEISIRDNGPGIAAEVQKRLFEPFFTTKNRGTGLGMSISKRIVDAHDGRMSVRNGAPVEGYSNSEILLLLPIKVD